MSIEIGACDAKNRLPELLRNVQAGRRYVITERGRAIAELIPVRSERTDTKDVIARIRAMQKPAGTVTRKEVASWKSERRT